MQIMRVPGTKWIALLLVFSVSCIMTGCRFFSPSGSSGLPEVDIVNPQYGDTVSAAYAFIQVTVTSREEIKKVRFFDNNHFLGEAYDEPFEHLWETAYVSNGLHELSAEAADASGNTGRSENVAVYVSKGAFYDWALVTSPTAEDLHRLFALDEQNIWACGNKGTILCFDGSQWYPEDIPPLVDNDLFDIHLISPDKGWCVGDNTMLALENGEWSVLLSYSKKRLCAFTMLDDTTGWVGDDQGIVYTFDGDTLLEYDTLGSTAVTDILGLSHSDVWASCGSSLYHFDGGSWFCDTVFSGAQINVLHSTGGSSIWAGGTALYFNNGSAWEMWLFPIANHEAFGVDNFGPESVTVCGEETGTGFIYSFCDTLWTAMSLQRDVPLYSLVGFANGDGWVVGAGGTILRRTIPSLEKRTIENRERKE
jgi:hypothetical protein